MAVRPENGLRGGLPSPALPGSGPWGSPSSLSAVRPLSRPVATPVTRRLVRSSSLDHLADNTDAARREGRAPRAERPGMHGPNVVSPAQAQAPIRPHTRCPGRHGRLRPDSWPGVALWRSTRSWQSSAPPEHPFPQLKANVKNGRFLCYLWETPRGSRRCRLPGSTVSHSVPARLTCQAAAYPPAPPSGHIPGHAKGPLPDRKRALTCVN